MRQQWTPSRRRTYTLRFLEGSTPVTSGCFLVTCQHGCIRHERPLCPISRARWMDWPRPARTLVASPVDMVDENKPTCPLSRTALNTFISGWGAKWTQVPSIETLKGHCVVSGLISNWTYVLTERLLNSHVGAALSRELFASASPRYESATYSTSFAVWYICRNAPKQPLGRIWLCQLVFNFQLFALAL